MIKDNLIKCDNLQLRLNEEKPHVFKDIEGGYITFVHDKPVMLLGDLGRRHKFYSLNGGFIVDFDSLKRWMWDYTFGDGYERRVKYDVILNNMKVIDDKDRIVKELI